MGTMVGLHAWAERQGQPSIKPARSSLTSLKSESWSSSVYM